MRSLAGAGKPRTLGEEGSHDQRLIEAVYESAHEGRTVNCGSTRLTRRRLMRRWNLVALFLPLALSPPSPAAAQAPDAKSHLGDNAALKYWTAFGLLPSLDKDQEKLLEEWNKVPLDAAALKLIDESRMSRQYLLRGARLPRCDWSLDYEDGIRLLLPHLSKSLTLARLAALDARHEFEQGHWQAGWDDVIALLKLARQVEMTPIMIGNLVGYRIEATAIEAAAPYLPELERAVPEATPAALDALPAGSTLQQLVLTERQVGPMWLIRELKEAERRKAGSWQDVWKDVFASTEGSDRDLLPSAKTFEQAIKMLEDLLPLNDQLAKVAALPWKEFDAQYPEFVKKKAPTPLAGFLLPSMDKYVAAQRRNQAQMALFKAALAVVQGGPDRLKDIKDPFGDGPFEYRALDKGFELKSKLLFKG
jgi:hypothetical protein